MRLEADRPEPAAPAAPHLRGRPPCLEIVHAGICYSVAVKRVGTARRFTLRVRSATQDAVLTMPSRASLRTALSFAERHAEWIGTRMRSLPGYIVLAPGAAVPLRGVDHVIVHDPHAPGRPRVEADSLCDVPRLIVSGALDAVGTQVLAFLQREALGDLRAAARHHAETVGKSFGRIVIRDTRSRWGSCSSRGTLSFSWRLILAPSFVLDYLAAHEVAHLCHMDHSAAFWAVTERLAPHTAQAEAWLKRHGPSLHRYAAQ